MTFLSSIGYIPYLRYYIWNRHQHGPLMLFRPFCLCGRNVYVQLGRSWTFKQSLLFCSYFIYLSVLYLCLYHLFLFKFLMCSGLGEGRRKVWGGGGGAVVVCYIFLFVIIYMLL